MNENMLPGSGEQNDESPDPRSMQLLWARALRSKRNYELAPEVCGTTLNSSNVAGSSARELKLKDSRHADETGERVGLHFDHYAFAMCLDRTLRSSQLGSHLLVQQTRRD
jgi:hypothetical protein